MERTIYGYDAWRLYWVAVVAGILGLVGAAVAFPRAVYDGFIWRYFWGPVVADGQGVACAEYVDGETVLHTSAAACQGAAGIVATPGYTTTSTTAYAFVLLVAIVGIYLGFERLDIGTEPRAFFALVPFVFLGGTMRVLEDATLAVPEGAGVLVPSFPATALLISPFIYFVVFVLALAAFGVGLALARRGLVEGYEVPVAAIGTALFVLALAYLAYLSLAIPAVTFVVALPVLVLGGATLLTALVWVAVERYAPVVNAGTGAMGAIIVWGHAVDAIANVLSLDWGDALGLGTPYEPKHVVNALVAEVTEAVQPPAVTEAIGSVWPFIPLKILVAVLVVYLFDDRMLEESPRFTLLMLIAVLAVGLGPGTRDLLRATLGI